MSKTQDVKLNYKDKNVETLFKERQDDRVELLKESIEDLNSMLSSREQLHTEMFQNLDKIDLFINNSMPKTASGESTQDLVKELIKKKIELEEIKLQEALDFWRDQALLKKELREHMKEFRDLQSKTSMLDNILEI